MLFPCLKHYYLRLDRNNGVGLCSMVARIGGIVSPYVVLLVTIFFQYSPFYGVFSHDVTAAILVSQNNRTAAMLVSLTNPLGVECHSYANAFFCSNKFA